MKDKIFYVYRLITSKNEVIYVGKGSGNRMYKHSIIAMGNSINRNANPKLYNKIKNIIEDGGYIKPEIIFQSLSEVDCLNEEIRLIKEIGLQNLCNLTIGGEGTSGYKPSDATKAKMSLAKKGKKRYSQGKRGISDAHKEKLLNNPQIFKTGHDGYWKDKTLSNETKLKMSKAKKGKKSGPITEKRRLAIINGIKNRKDN